MAQLDAVRDLSKVYEYILEFYSPFKVQSYDGSFKHVTTVLQQKIRYNASFN